MVDDHRHGRLAADREAVLLDFHLDRLTDDQRTWIESELLRDPALRAKSDRLREILRPLDHWSAPPVPGNLVDRVLLRIQDQADQDEGPEPVTVFAEEAGSVWRGPFRSVRELIAVAACILFLITTAFPAVSMVRARAQRAACAGNLGAIFRGTTLYQQAFAGALPFAGGPAEASWLPVANVPALRPSGGRASTGWSSENEAHRPFASNSRHVFLIAKLNYGPALKDFVCPSSSSDTPMRQDGLCGYTDFASGCNISYATMNMAGYDPGIRRTRPIAFVSDPNPLFRGGRFDRTVEPTTNSSMHGGSGQTVLILDGSVVYMKSPIIGPSGDNLWLSGNTRQYIGTETAADRDDAFLIPGYPAPCKKARSQF